MGRAGYEIEGNGVRRLWVVKDLQFLTPGFAPRPERLVFGAVDRQIEINGLQRARRSVEENAAAGHREARRPPSSEKAHAVEFGERRRVAEDDGREVSEVGIAE